ncbi:MAG TPA: carboxypeptidase-like regulatory domain-containing protein [Chryseosolibacter sp.]
MKRLLSLTMIAAVFALAIVACKDDFNEEEFLRLQSELKLKEDEVLRQRLDSASEEAVKEYIAAANEAGDLLAVSLMLRENGNALAGVTVTLSSGTPQEISSGRAKAVTTGTTDASGNVVFDRVTIGSGTATFSKQGYVTATATYDFGPVPGPTAIQVSVPNGNTTITKYVPPVKRFEEAVVPMISATPSEGSTAIISGKVTIENDLTNLTPEVPAGIVLRANLTNLLGTNQGIFTSYVLADNSTLGRATIAADGTYSMIVPATAAGNDINFIVPNIEGTCRMAVNGYDNGTGAAVALPLPEYRNVPTSWGPGLVASQAIPVVAGARVVVPNAPAAGSGLSFTFSPVGRTLVAGTISSNTESKIGSTYYRISNRGSFTTTIPPVVTIGGNGSGITATATAALQALVTSISVTSPGSGFDGFVDLQLVANLQGGGTSVLSTVLNIPTSNGMFPTTVNLDLFTGTNEGFGSDEAAVQLAADVTSLFLRVVNGGLGPIVDPVFSMTNVIDLRSVTITGIGSGFTSKPTFTFSSGGAAIEVLEFPVFWTVTPVMGAGTDYAVMPEFTINCPQSYSQTGTTSHNVHRFNSNGTADAASQDLASQLTISSGDIVSKFPSMTFQTTFRSETEPTMTITNILPQNARFTFDAADISSTTGEIIGNPTVNNFGAGYNAKLTGQIVPTIAGAPGTGATISFDYTSLDYNSVTHEWTYPGSIDITNPGSGYLRNLNQRDFEVSNLPTKQTVQPGKTYTVNFAFGSGFRRAAVN